MHQGSHMSGKRIAGLDGVRAVCVLLVFVEHFVLWNHGLGGLGVKVFFALSGFLIIGILHAQRLKIEAGRSSGAAELRQFWTSRVLRIFPAYYLVLALITVYILAKKVPSQGLGYYWLFLGNVYVQHVSHTWGMFTHLWSISVEQHFYMLASPVLLWAPTRRHLGIVVGLFVASEAAAAWDYMTWSSVPTPYLSDLPNFAFMACGGLLALTRTKQSGAWFAPVAGVVFLVSSVVFVAIGFDQLHVAGDGLRRAITGYASLGLSVGAIAYVTSRPGSMVVSALELAPVRYLGKVSYGFYIYHYFFPAFAQYAGRVSFIPHASGLLTVFQFLCTVAVAGASWRYIEQPILALKRRPGAAPSVHRAAS
jgi:peptidoglycan/LPS O-acetylase OafA/YrhL